MTNSNDQNMGIITISLALIALLSLSATLLFTLIAILCESNTKGDLLELTKILLGWPFVSGGLAVVAAHTFRKEIEEVIGRIRRKNPDDPSGV